MTKQIRATIAAMFVLSTVSMQAQANAANRPRPSGKKAARKPAESRIQTEIRELREQMLNQQGQIDALKTQLADRDARLATVQQTAQTAETTAATASAKTESVSSSVAANTEAVTALNSNVTALRSSNAGLTQTLTDTKKEITEKIESPLTMRYKGIAITPVAFFALENVYRQRSLNSDVNTPFNTTPFPGAAEARTSEFNFSARQSRIGGLFEGNTGPFKLSGYVEADFLSAGVTSNENQSNSYTLRQRQIWGQVATNGGFVLTGGQMWSLVTETKKSTDVRTENLPMTVDSQYHVGLSWARQAAIRFQQRFTNGLTLAGALEEAQNIFSATNQNSNFFFGSAGAGGGLLNSTANYSNNVAPDVIVKATHDSRYGHYELGGIARFFRVRHYPNVTTAGSTAVAGAANDTKTGGGVFAGVRFPVTTLVDFGLHGMAGTGVGRYGTSTLPDTTVHPDGTLAPIKNYQALFSMEFHPTPRLDVSGYAGAEYAQRTVYLSTLGSSAGRLIGYAPPTASNAGCNVETVPTGNTGYMPGVPANCLGATRAVIQGTASVTYRVYNTPRYGRLQYQLQYSYLTRETWTGVGGSPKATNNMVFTGMRYYIP